MHASMTILYRVTSGVRFDMNYWTNTHLPEVYKHWKQYGMLSWKIIQFEEPKNGADLLYTLQATLTFTSLDAIKAANASPEAKDLYGDIPKFTELKPLILTGEIIASS